jgi:DNA-binding NarL/FixJ family response regulator
MPNAMRTREFEAVARLCRTARSELALFDGLSQQLHKLVPYDGAAWFATDPTTLLGTSAVRVENIEPGHCETYWEREYLVEDALLFRDVARSTPGAGTLYDATGHRPGRSARYREYLAPQGYGDELRAVFRLGGTTWGVLDLYRDRSAGPFSASEVVQVQQIAPTVARALRAFAAEARGSAVADSPGTALFDRRGALIFLDDQAERLFEEIGGLGWRRFPASMTAVKAILARVTAVERGRDRGPVETRLRAASGRWLALNGAGLHGPDGSDGPVAVTVGAARPDQVAPIIMRAYSLTAREQQVTRGVSRGLANQEIAAELFLSTHTVRDYLKAIYEKVGVTSRGELVARLFAEHHHGDPHPVDVAQW